MSTVLPRVQKTNQDTSFGWSNFFYNFRLRRLAENYQKVGDDLLQSLKCVKKTGVPLCLDHEDEKMHYYCISCSSLACQACMVLKHNGTGHDIEGVKEMCSKQRVEMKFAINRAKSRINAAESTLDELKMADIQSTEVCEDIKKQIDKHTESHVNELLTQSQELKKQIEQARYTQADGLKRESSTVQKCIESANVAYQAAVNATANLTDYEYITQHATLINKMEDIVISKQTKYTDITKRDVIKFLPFNSSHAKLGQIISVNQREKVRTIKKIQTLDGLIGVFRVFCSPDGLLVFADKEKVFVYHKVNGKYINKFDFNLKIERISHFYPTIALCPDGRFMAARDTCIIEVYSADGNHQNDIQIELPDYEDHGRNIDSRVNPSYIMVTSDGRILVVDYLKFLIVEVNPTGEVIRTTHTIIKPSHMVLIHDTHVAISDCGIGKVVVIDIKSGQETLSIDIRGVEGICYDEHTESLLIARSKPLIRKKGKNTTGVIDHQYSYTTGKLIASLQKGLYSSQGLALTSEGHLFVETRYETVDIYEIK